MEDGVKSKSSIAFIVELFMLFVILLLVIVVITQVFVMSRRQSSSAAELTGAVIAAESVAETASQAGSPEELVEILEDTGEARDVKALAGGGVTMTYESGEKKYKVAVDLTSENKNETGEFIRTDIKVMTPDSQREIYKLSTGNYRKEED